MINNPQQKAEKLAKYLIAQAPSLASAVTIFNIIASQIKNNTTIELNVLADQELA